MFSSTMVRNDVGNIIRSLEMTRKRLLKRYFSRSIQGQHCSEVLGLAEISGLLPRVSLYILLVLMNSCQYRTFSLDSSRRGGVGARSCLYPNRLQDVIVLLCCKAVAKTGRSIDNNQLVKKPDALPPSKYRHITRW